MYIHRCTCMYADVHTHTHTHIFVYAYIKSAEARCFYGQLTTLGHSRTQILELKRITPLSKQSSL